MSPRNFEEKQDNLNLISDSTAAVKESKVQRKLVWRNILWMLYLHLSALYSFYLLPDCQWKTILFAILLYVVGGLGVTAGAHRLWAHRSYKAALPLRIFLAFCFTTAFQNDIYEWSRDHRAHHKYSETDADPHNAKRGLFFSHVGWLLVRKHPHVAEKGRKIDLTDLSSDPVVKFQRKYYLPLVLLCCFILPTYVPTLWGESAWNSYYVCGLLRYAITLNATWLVNSLAHAWGNKPYDKSINPVENIFVVLGAIGEGFHNYHHTFPQDYATSEFGKLFNLTTTFIDCMERLGFAYDLKTTPKSVVQRQKEKRGDGSEGFGLL